MTTAINEANYRRLIEEGFNQGNLEVADELIADGAQEHHPLPADCIPRFQDHHRGCRCGR